jgi:uncharacterized membrane protein
MWDWLTAVCKSAGCHQLPARSFFYRDRQFPMCARCTGVFIGHLVAYTMFWFYEPRVAYLLFGCGVILADWLLQYMKIRMSTNPRRLITGLIGGYSSATLALTVIAFCIRKLFAN